MLTLIDLFLFFAIFFLRVLIRKISTMQILCSSHVEKIAVTLTSTKVPRRESLENSQQIAMDAALKKTREYATLKIGNERGRSDILCAGAAAQ